jgi:D-3-phosphoglycerate dehydrogenase
MRAVFVDANDTLADVTDRLLRPDDPAVVIHRDPSLTSDQLPAVLAGAEIAIVDHS